MYSPLRFSLFTATATLLGGIGLSAAEPAASKLDSAALANTIDRHLSQRLQAEKVTPSPLADDAEFLRRAYLDITGHIPLAGKAAAFLADGDPAKRARLIDELLASPDFGKHQSDIWQALLLTRNSDNRGLSREPMVKWLEDSFNQNKPWNKMVHELLTVTGPQDKNGAVTFFVANATVDKLTDTTAKVFLGVQLQCAQCHNHPFTDWKQTEYWHMAAFFMKVQATAARAAVRQGEVPTVTETSRPRRGRNALPESAKVLPPKFLQGEQPKVKDGEPLRPILADWLTSAANPYFSKALVNRMWSEFFGRGLVNPVDDMHEGNAPSHPELLKELARQFSANDFDVKYLVRALCNSQAYQRSSKPFGNNADASPVLYSRMAVKVLSPEQLYDSFAQVLGAADRGNGPGRRAFGAGAGRGGPPNARAAFVAFFMLEDGADATEYQAGIPQVLRLMNSAQMNNGGSLARILKDGEAVPEAVEHLYLAGLSRKPSGTELEKMTAYVKHQNQPRQGYADLLWAMLNSSEFTLNH